MSRVAQTTIAATIGVLVAVAFSATIWLSPRPTAPTEPAPLPVGTGIDGAGAGDQLIVQPDAGPDVRVEPGPDGTGGEVYGRTRALYHGQTDVRVNAGKWYGSGGAHFAIDWGVWRGTPVYAPRDALVVGRNNGVPNDLGGSASNWVLLCRIVEGKPALLYLQHLSPGYIHQRGPVKSGALVGRSGNSGHSTGDHLHEAAGWSPYSCATITQSRAEWVRYLYLNDTSTSIFEPTKWEAEPEPLTVRLRHQQILQKLSGRSPQTRWIRCNLGGLPCRHGANFNRWTPPVTQRVRVWQRRIGYPVTGVFRCGDLTALGRRGAIKFVTVCR